MREKIKQFPWTINFIRNQVSPSSTLQTPEEKSRQPQKSMKKELQCSKPDQKLRKVTSGVRTQSSICQICNKNANSEVASGSWPWNRANLKPVLFHKREFLYFGITKDRHWTFQEFGRKGWWPVMQWWGCPFPTPRPCSEWPCSLLLSPRPNGAARLSFTPCRTALISRQLKKLPGASHTHRTVKPVTNWTHSLLAVKTGHCLTS